MHDTYTPQHYFAITNIVLKFKRKCQNGYRRTQYRIRAWAHGRRGYLMGGKLFSSILRRRRRSDRAIVTEKTRNDNNNTIIIVASFSLQKNTESAVTFSGGGGGDLCASYTRIRRERERPCKPSACVHVGGGIRWRRRQTAVAASRRHPFSSDNHPSQTFADVVPGFPPTLSCTRDQWPVITVRLDSSAARYAARYRFPGFFFSIDGTPYWRLQFLSYFFRMVLDYNSITLRMHRSTDNIVAILIII